LRLLAAILQLALGYCADGCLCLHAASPHQASFVGNSEHPVALQCFPDQGQVQGGQGVFAVDTLGFPIQCLHPNEKPATGNNERNIRSTVLLGRATTP
jgi:hypothetical protein